LLQNSLNLFTLNIISSNLESKFSSINSSIFSLGFSNKPNSVYLIPKAPQIIGFEVSTELIKLGTASL